MPARSKRCVFLSHCLLAQGVRAEGLAREAAAAVPEVLSWCLENEINIMQMPCPEMRTKSGGLGRAPHGKKWYDSHGLRDTCREIALDQVAYMRTLIDGGYHVLAVVGIEFSPACAATYLNKGQRIQRDKGIFIEELEAAMKAAGVDVPIRGLHQGWKRKMDTTLHEIIAKEQMELAL